MQSHQRTSNKAVNSADLVSGITTTNAIELIRATGESGIHRTFPLAARDLPVGVGRQDDSSPCVAVLAESSDIANIASYFAIKCFGPPEEPNRNVLILLGNSSIAMDFDSLAVNLLSRQCFSVLFVHAVGWTIARFNVADGDRQRLLAALFGAFGDIDCKSFSQSELMLPDNVRFGSLDVD
ncbi:MULTISPECIES: hypothetical protein [Burkholderiaceae]|uniref:Uncharacterized protein n=1 Tax=Caballeronia zhejiangensis TaxID=871203 RepID=A0A656QL03_9BURK|nr:MULTISPECIES: hypothetical protein [Burkholderiaceae]KAK43940.1 hypothetical protein BG58_28470 [Caballeronia jiangsuensis]KDR28888.1 hypothetical protein BG60_09265 [Caballeronia zhejiangensis]KWU19225.1 hypothetical protein AS149_13350 [Burkholderia cenocepacia]SAL57668.1 hypothetical protein AWB71_03141 [Caballeronia peredens]